MLVIESENDQIVPHAAVTSYVDACVRANSMTYRVIKGADHGIADEEHHACYSSLLVNWLREMVTGARAGPVSAQRPAAANAPSAGEALQAAEGSGTTP